MAFGDTGILDNFNRSNGGPPIPGGNWTATGRDVVGFNIDNNQIEAVSTSNLAEEYWNVENFGPDCEAFMGIVTTATNMYFAVNVRMTDEDTSEPNSYYVQGSGASTVKIWRMDGGSDTQLGADISQGLDADDALGIQAIGSSIDAYFNNDGAGWSSIGTRTDETYSSAGKIALTAYLDGGSVDLLQLDNLGGGTVGSATLTISVSDGLTVADSPTITPLVLGNVNQSESVTLGDTPTVSRQEATTLTISVSDGLTVADAPTLQLDRLITSSDGLTVGESVTITPLVLGDVSQSDGLTVGDTPIVSRQEATTLTISSSDGLTVGDSASVHRRAAWYNPESITVNTGSVKNGTIESTWADDGTKLQLGEVTGTPGFDYDFYFYDVPALAFSIGINGYYEGNVGHQIKIQQYNFTATDWTDLTAELDDFPTAASDQDYDFAIFNDADYNSSGEMRFKIVHNSGGSNTHNFYIDHMLLEAHLAIHTNEDVTLTDTPALDAIVIDASVSDALTVADSPSVTVTEAGAFTISVSDALTVEDAPAIDALLIDLTASEDLTVGDDATVAVESLIAALEIRITPGVVVS